MKKFIIIASALVFTTGMLTSKTKVSTAKTATVATQNNFSTDRKDLASAD